MKKMRILSLLLTVALLLSILTACGKKAEDPADSDKKPAAEAAVTSLAEAEAAIADGHYEAAYLYLLTDPSDEAVELRQKFFYVPVEVTQTMDGEVCATGRWTYDDKGYPLLQQTDSDWPDSIGLKPAGSKVECTYDERGNLLKKISLTVVNGKETRKEIVCTYDADGNRLTEKRTASDGTWTEGVCTYDADGNLLTVAHSNSNGQNYTMAYTYDADGNCITYDYVYGDSASHYDYTYDEAGNRLTSYRTRDDGTWEKTVCTYDADGNETSKEETDSEGNVEKWYLDGTKKVTETKEANGSSSKKIENGTTTLYEYSITYEETHEWEGNVIPQGRWTEIEKTYDDKGNPLCDRQWMGCHPDVWELPNESFGRYTLWTYDDKGNLLSEEEYTYTDEKDREGSSTLVNTVKAYTYVYGAEGKATERTQTAGKGKGTKTVYTYDDLGRVYTAESRNEDGSWTRDYYVYRNDEDSGFSLVWEYDNLNGSYRKFTFDENGDVIFEEQAEDGEVTKKEYTRNAEGKMLSQKITYPDGTYWSVAHTYDENGRQRSKETVEPDGTWEKETYNAAGCLLTMESHYGVVSTFTWELRYYPDEMPEQMSSRIVGCRQAADYFADGIYTHTWDQ